MKELVSSDFLRVLLALKENIMKDINVAEVCRVQSIVKNNYLCESLADSTLVNAICMSGVTANVGDFVVIVFCNRDFRANLSIASFSRAFRETDNNQRHSNAFGVIIGKVLEEE